MKHMVFGKIAVSALGLLAGTLFAGGTVLAGAPDADVDESTSLRLASTGLVPSALKAFARVQLRIGQGAGPGLRATAQIEGDGLTENRLYDLWLTTQEGNSILLGTGRADEECDAGDCEIIVNLRGHLLQPPSSVTTLEGTTITIREHFRLGLLGSAPVVATRTVAASDLN